MAIISVVEKKDTGISQISRLNINIDLKPHV